METQLSLESKKRTKREVQVRERVPILAKYRDTVIRDIKYVVGDLQFLLEQIDVVSRQLDQSSQTSATGDVKLGGNERGYRCFCSQSPASDKLTKSLVLRDKRVSSGSKRAKRTNRSRRLIEVDSSSASSPNARGSSDQRHACRDNVMEFETASVEFNTMWDNAFDKDLLVAEWAHETEEHLGCVVGSKDSLFHTIEDTKQDVAKRSSWLNGKLEQSLTSGIDMLSFTDESDEEYLSSALLIYDAKYGNVHREFLVSVDPYHVCCKDVIPLGSDLVYCGVYEALLDACLEPYSGMVDNESFGSDITSFGGGKDTDDVTAVNYEPAYDTQLNTWTAYTMVALDSIHASEEELSETALDILNDNIPPSTQIDNIGSSTVNNGTEHNEDITTTDNPETTNNRYIINR